MFWSKRKNCLQFCINACILAVIVVFKVQSKCRVLWLQYKRFQTKFVFYTIVLLFMREYNLFYDVFKFFKIVFFKFCTVLEVGSLQTCCTCFVHTFAFAFFWYFCSIGLWRTLDISQTIIYQFSFCQFGRLVQSALQLNFGIFAFVPNTYECQFVLLCLCFDCWLVRLSVFAFTLLFATWRSYVCKYVQPCKEKFYWNICQNHRQKLHIFTFENSVWIAIFCTFGILWIRTCYACNQQWCVDNCRSIFDGNFIFDYHWIKK